MADIVKNCYNFWIGLRPCDLEDCTLQLRFHKDSIEFTIFRLHNSALNFGNPPLWTIPDVSQMGLLRGIASFGHI